MNMPQLAGKEFQPTRFTERGAAVPFTTPILNQGRVRVDNRQVLELLVPAFSGGQGIYAIRWRDLPEIFSSMTVHDRALHEDIQDSKAVSPGQIRACAMRVAATGLAGPEAAKAARKYFLDIENDRILTTFHLVKSAVEQIGVQSHLTLHDVASVDGQLKVKQAVAAVAQKVGRAANQVYSNLETWGSILSPVGVPDMPGQSRLRRLTNEVTGLAQTFYDFAATDPSDARAMGEVAATVATFTAEKAKIFLQRADQLSGTVPAALRDWDKSKERITADVERIEWLLDGWDFISTVWHDAENQEREQRRRVMAEIHRILPIPPAREFEAPFAVNKKPADNCADRYLKMLNMGQVGAIDPDEIQRLERYKQRAV